MRRAALVAAARDLLATEGARGTTVRRVCTHAGLSSRYFYESFADLDELLVDVSEELYQEFVAAIADLPTRGGDLRTAVAGVVEAFHDALEDSEATRVLVLEAWGSEALLRRHVARMHETAGRLATEVQRRHPGAESYDNVRLAAFSVAGGLLQTVIAWDDGALAVPRRWLIEGYIDMASAMMRHAVERDMQGESAGTAALAAAADQ